MYIYNYDRDTKEYTGSSLAIEDPVESKKQGGFVPLIPSCSTTLEPPIAQENEVAVFDNNNWVIKPDYRGQKQVEKATKEISEIKDIGIPSDEYQLVSDAMAEDILNHPEKYEIVNDELVDISNTPEYHNRQIEEKQKQWNHNFIQTSFGWLRINTAVGDILSILNSFSIIINVQGKISEESILFYRTPDFEKEFDENYLKTLQDWNEEFNYEMFQQLFNEVAQRYLERFKG